VRVPAIGLMANLTTWMLSREAVVKQKAFLLNNILFLT